MSHRQKPAPAAAAGGGPKPKVLFVLGGPGAGKGTQCGLIVKHFGFEHLSAGDLLRAEVKSGSPDGDLISKLIKEGKIVPVEITVKLLKNAMAKSPRSRFLIDGFPRNFDNVQGWEKVVGEEADVLGVLFYDTAEDVMERRLVERGKTSGRTDDNVASIKKRFRTFLDSTMPVVEHYAKQGKVRRICSSAPIEEVFEDTKRVIAPIVEEDVLDANKRLLASIGSGDLDTYRALTSDDMTCFENETLGLRVEGREFHDFYLNLASGAKGGAGRSTAASKTPARVQSTMSAPSVRLLGPTTAVVSYNRLVQTPTDTKVFAETRVWSDEGGSWVNVHFHRSSAGRQARPQDCLSKA